MKNKSKYYFDSYGGRAPKQFFWFNMMVFPWIFFCAGWLDWRASVESIIVYCIGGETLRRMLIHRGEIIIGNYVDKTKD